MSAILLIMLIALGVILFVLLVVVHEFGHFIAAKKSGVAVEEFGIGFPPKAKTITKKNGTEYTLNWLPIGGFVTLKGEYSAAKEKGSFGAATRGRKVLIILAGVMMNWLVAAGIFTILALFGMPQLVNNQYQVASDATVSKQEVFAGDVVKGSPAEQVGIEAGDTITSIDGTQIQTSDQLKQQTDALSGQSVEIVYQHGGETVTKYVQLRDDPQKGNLGVSPGERTLVRSTWSAPIVGVGTTVQFTIETFKGIFGALGNLFTGNGSQASESVTGPVGIIVILKDLAREGILFVLFLIGVISVSLAVMNVLPIPALDGGRLFVMGLFWLLRRPLTKEREQSIHGTGMLVLLLLALVITVVDIRRFF